MDYEKKYKEALERASKICNSDFEPNDKSILCSIIFPELKESEERIRQALISILKSDFEKETTIFGISVEEIITWLEKQDKIVDCQQNHQDVKHPNGGIVMEDFNGGEGFYKLHLDYLSKKQVEEVEEMVRMWNKESKTSNENIKTCVEMCLTDANEQRFEDFGITLKDCLAWLEKQGEQKSTLPKWKYKKDNIPLLRDSLILNKYGCVGKSLSGAIVSDVWVLDYNELAKLPKEEIEKQGEQKHFSDFKAKDWYVSKVDGKIHNMTYNPTDKVEPRFHEGDWITNGVYTWKIIGVKSLDYILQSQDGNIVDDTISYVDEHFHFWTIQDAKDGDVLVCKGNIKNSNGIKYERICLFNNLDNAFFTLTKTSNNVEEYDIDINIDYPDNTIPATKGQKEILFMVMKEAGYKWDSEKKELKEIEPKILDTNKVINWVNPDRVIEWLKDTINETTTNYGVYKETHLTLPYNSIEDLINDFKEDFGL